MSERVSIVMPAFNSGMFISQSIESVINQSFQDWELIIINDCSIDNTKNIALQYSQTDSRIKVYDNKQNLGVSYSRNRGIDYSNSKWIAFLDSDDIWEPDKLEKQLNFASRMNASFIFTAVKYIDVKGVEFKGQFKVPSFVDFDKLKYQNYISCSSVLIKKSTIGSVRMYNDRMHEDYAFWLQILKKNQVAYGLNEPLLVYRISRESKSGNKVRTLKMTFMVFRHLGFNFIEATTFALSHILRSLLKYYLIFRR